MLVIEVYFRTLAYYLAILSEYYLFVGTVAPLPHESFRVPYLQQFLF